MGDFEKAGPTGPVSVVTRSWIKEFTVDQLIIGTVLTSYLAEEPGLFGPVCAVEA
jgi:hypothetical protein